MTELVAACGRYPEPTVVQRPQSLPTRVERTGPPATVTPVPTTPTPAPTPKRVFAPTDLDPYAALYVAEREGIYVTSRRRTARYFYRWDDRRWATTSNRVWFRTVQDLKTVFPDRVAAP